MHQHQSINRKLSYVIMFTSGAALVVAFLGFMVTDLVSYKQVLERDVTTKVRLVGRSAGAALQFGDPVEAEEALQALQVDPAVEGAMLLTPTGSQLAAYGSVPTALGGVPYTETQPDVARRTYARTHFEVYEPIVFQSEQVGGIWVRYSLSPFYMRLVRYLLIAIVVLVLASGIAVLVARRLRRGISDPILALAATARQVSEAKDYRVRARHTSNDEIGLLSHTFNAMLDTIERRDQELAQHRDDLEAQVLTRTAELRAAKEEAEQASHFKSQILTNITHEFRTPLAGIVGATTVLREEVDETMADFVDMIEVSGQRLFDTLESVLNLARLEAGDITLVHRPLDIGKQATLLVIPYQREARQKGLACEVVADGVQHPVWLDPFVLEVVVKALLSNAVKFTATGKVTLELKTTETGVLIAVRDTGVGIGTDFLPLLYEPFKQESTGLKRKFEGSGLGLAVLRRTIDLLEGDITVETEVGGGTTFTVTLARERCRSQKPRSQEPRSQKPIPNERSRGAIAPRRAEHGSGASHSKAQAADD